MRNSNLTLGSLFDGSGGFPLAGMLSGITPVWLSEIEPFPIRVTSKRMPWIKNYGDISQMDGGEIEPVDIITFGSPCFPAGTLVLTSEGMKEIEKICVGDMVLTHKGRWRKVTATGSKTAPTIRLKGQHYGLVCTENHPIYNLEDGEYKWTEASKMNGKLWGVPNKTEYLPITLPMQMDRKTKPMPEISDGFFYFVGRWLGDGWVRDGHRSGRPEGQRFATIYLCDSADKLEELKDTLSCISARYSIEHGDTCVKVRCNSRLLCDWLVENFGKYAWAKEIPSWALSMKEEFRMALLRGILDSDGYRKKTSYKITTVSKKLAFGVRLLAESLGYTTTVYFCECPCCHQIDGRTVNQRDTYSVEIFDKGSRISDGCISWYRVKSVAPEKTMDVVYNLTVDEDNSYTADSIVVHNCQDMSVAGKRDGLDGSRSSLFYEAVRIIKEMRCATNGKYPKYIVWENVPGAFSSNGGEDFRCVCESICRVKNEQLSVPRPAKWPYSGEIVGENFSLAWRQFDAQYWGVPQRRKRIYLVADFNGGCAGKILFESEGLSGYTPQGFRTWQETAGGTAESLGETGCYGVDGYNSAMDDVAATLGVNCGMSTGRNGALVLNDQGGNRMDITEEMTCTLRAEAHHPPVVIDEAIPIENHPTDSRVTLSSDGKVQTLTSRMGTGGNNVPLLMKIRCGCEGGGKGPLIQEDRSATLSCNNDQTLFEPRTLDCRNLTVNEEKSGTLQAKNNGGHSLNFTNPVAYGICSKDSNAMKSANPNSGFYEAKTTRTLDANGGNPSCNQGGMAVVALSDKSAALTAMDGPKGPHSQQLSNPTESFVLETVALEGNGSRPSHHGDGYSEEAVSYTLNATEQHGVAYGIGRDAFNQGQNALFRPAIEEELQPTIVAKGPGAVAEPTFSSSKASFFTYAEKELANTLVATDYKDPPLINYGEAPEYIVRRLTPTECAKLQGFPDWWCSDLGTEHPTDAEVYEWYKIFETHRRVVGGSSKPKTEKQIRAFLKEPHSDSAEYKMWGNGIALPNAYFVLSGIAWVAGMENSGRNL